MELKGFNVNLEYGEQALQFRILCPSYNHFCETLIHGKQSITVHDAKASLLFGEILYIGITCGCGEDKDLKAFVLISHLKERNVAKDKG